MAKAEDMDKNGAAPTGDGNPARECAGAMVIRVVVDADFEPVDGSAFDAVRDALDFSEIPAVVTMEKRSRFESALEPMAAISIAHLSEATLERLLAGSEGYEGLTHYPNEYGAFLVVDSLAGSHAQPWPDSWPRDLVQLIETASAEGVQWLKLDADAPQIEGLPVYPRDSERDMPNVQGEHSVRMRA